MAASGFLKQLQKSLSGAFPRAFKDLIAGAQAAAALDDALSKIGLVPVGSIIPWHGYNGLVSVPIGWQLCNGGAISDPDSPLNGQNTPALNNDADPIFLGGYVTVGNVPTLVASNMPTHAHDAFNTLGGIAPTWRTNHSHTVSQSALNLASGTAVAGPGSNGAVSSNLNNANSSGITSGPDRGTDGSANNFPHHMKVSYIIRIK